MKCLQRAVVRKDSGMIKNEKLKPQFCHLVWKGLISLKSQKHNGVFLKSKIAQRKIPSGQSERRARLVSVGSLLSGRKREMETNYRNKLSPILYHHNKEEKGGSLHYNKEWKKNLRVRFFQHYCLKLFSNIQNPANNELNEF